MKKEISEQQLARLLTSLIDRYLATHTYNEYRQYVKTKKPH